jgi:hypothetical protein
MSAKCNSWIVDLTTCKVNDSTYIKMLLVQEMWKCSLNHSSIIAKYWIACVLIYYNKWKMQFVNDGFNILKVNGSTLIIEDMWKITNSFQYICGVLHCYMCFDKLWWV